jgi:hypothetical protein
MPQAVGDDGRWNTGTFGNDCPGVAGNIGGKWDFKANHLPYYLSFFIGETHPISVLGIPVAFGVDDDWKNKTFLVFQIVILFND